jgi:hypothetical protein
MTSVTDTVRIGSGAGFAGDRIDAAVDLVRDGALNDLVLECLAERTIALAHSRGAPTRPVATICMRSSDSGRCCPRQYRAESGS